MNWTGVRKYIYEGLSKVWSGDRILNITDETTPKMTLKQDPNDKYKQYEVDFHALEPCDIEDSECKQRHRDQILDQFCDTHPSAPQCKVYDD